jgi:hypothetical protein
MSFKSQVPDDSEIPVSFEPDVQLIITAVTPDVQRLGELALRARAQSRINRDAG